MATSGIELSLSPSIKLPAVSVVLPVLNEELHLANAVNSILSQDYSGPLEVILSLGPSKDKTNQIAKNLASSDSRITLVENPSGRTAAGLNEAINKSKIQLLSELMRILSYKKNYISQAIEVMKSSGAVNVGGIMGAEGKSLYSRKLSPLQ